VRALADRERIERFMRTLAEATRNRVRVYLVGGTTAVLMGWRASTVDVDLVMHPDDDAILRAIPRLKDTLQLNVELVSPAHFIPVPPGWEDRGLFIRDMQSIAYYHFDLYAQALAKIERGHRQDLEDVRAMRARGLIDDLQALSYYARIAPELYRFPAIDPATFERAVKDMFDG
jgi:hypothetical protein